MNENIFDKRRLKTFSNCKDLVKSMVGTRDGVIGYNEKFRLDLETTCYKASICENLQQENQELKEQLKDENNYHNEAVKWYKEAFDREQEIIKYRKALDEIREFVKRNISYEKNSDGYEEPYLMGYEISDLLQILDKAKGE